jgi:hypothetical protein
MGSWAARILLLKQQRITPMLKIVFWLMTAAMIAGGVYLIMYMQSAPGA